MKKIALLLMLMVGGMAMAQVSVANSAVVVDTTDEEANVIGGRVERSKHTSKESNVLGTPIYYDTNGNEVGGRHRSEEYHHPRHHYLNNLDDRYATFFFEGEMLLGEKNMAGGFNFTMIPDRWGGYGSVMFGLRDSYVTLGPAVRLSHSEHGLDWHLYGGLMLGGRHVGAECGLRVAAPQRRSEFCWTSASMGVAAVNGDVYLTVGFSLDILAGFYLWALCF